MGRLRRPTHDGAGDLREERGRGSNDRACSCRDLGSEPPLPELHRRTWAHRELGGLGCPDALVHGSTLCAFKPFGTQGGKRLVVGLFQIPTLTVGSGNGELWTQLANWRARRASAA